MRRVPRTLADTETLLASARHDGFLEGQAAANTAWKARHNPDHTRLEALKEATKFLSIAGQTLAAFADVMKSERNQL